VLARNETFSKTYPYLTNGWVFNNNESAHFKWKYLAL